MIIVPNECYKILFSKVTLNVAVPEVEDAAVGSRRNICNE